MQFFYIIFNVFQCNSTYTAYGSCKVFVDHFLRNTDCLKDLGSLVRLDRGNTHFGRNLDNTA